MVRTVFFISNVLRCAWISADVHGKCFIPVKFIFLFKKKNHREEGISIMLILCRK